MQNLTSRRGAVTGAFALLCEAVAVAQGQPQVVREPVFKHELPDIKMDHWEVTVSYVDLVPGVVGKAHRHAGFVLAYVLEGAIVTKISGQPETTYTAGQMFYEAPGSIHEVSRNASATQSAKLLAMIFAPKGATLTVPI